MRTKGKVHAIVAAILAATLGIATTTWTHASAGSTDNAILTGPVTDGLGETLLLVVADVVPRADELARLGEINRHFGDLQGFYANDTDGYDVTGALVQTTPDAVATTCPPFLDVFKTIVGSQLVDVDCPEGRVVNIFQPLATTFVPVADLSTFPFPSPCGGSGLAPCQQDRLIELLGDDLRFDPGLSMIGTAFRTKRGAQEFLELARSAGVTDLVTLQVRKLVGGDIGVGQESNPDGSGPLTGPLPDQEHYQR
jgi:hypothetical protein